jgi:hypothetical protein
LRLFHRIINSAVAAQAATALQPHQWGIGVRGGTETIAHACRIFAGLGSAVSDPALVIQTLDIKNAYNTISRGAIANGINKRLPALGPWFRWAYADATDLLAPDGRALHSCATGVKQGDPLASVLFCLGLQDALEAVAARSAGRVVVLADMDDVTLLGPSAEMAALVDSFGRQVERLGLQLNRAKCKRMPLNTTQSSSSSAVMGLTIMGTFIGDDTYREQRLAETFDALHATTVSIAAQEPAVALALLKYCANARPVYLARTMRPDDLIVHATRFDTAVDAALMKIAGHSLAAMPEVSAALRTLRVVDGGLGMHKIGTISPAAFVASFTAALTNLFTAMPQTMRAWHSLGVLGTLQEDMAYVRSHAPEWVEETRNSPSLTIPCWPDSTLELQREADPMLTLDPVEVPEAPAQRTLCAPLREQSKNHIHLALATDRHALAWWRSGSFRGAASWMRASFLKALNLSPPEYRTALRHRLLLPARGAPEGAYLRCNACGMSDRTEDYRYHGMNCILTAPIRTSRHTAIKRALAEMLTKVFGAGVVALEVPLGPGLRTPDITVTTETQVRAIDVCVVNPAAERYCAGLDPPAEGKAAAMAERRKELAYASSLAARNLSPDALIPFAMETTGRLGTRAQAFLDALHLEVPPDRAATVQDAVSFAISRLRIITIRGNNYTSTAHNPHLQTLRGPVVSAQQTTDAGEPSPVDN